MVRYKPLFEIVQPETKFISDKLEQVKSEVFGKQNHTIETVLNKVFADKKINFEYGGSKISSDQDWSKVGLIGAYIEDDFQIVVNYNDHFYKSFTEPLWNDLNITLKLIIGHELVHAEQFETMGDDWVQTLKIDPQNGQDYLSFSHEIVAFAMETVQELLYKGFSLEQIKSRIQNPYSRSEAIPQTASDIFDRYLTTFSKGHAELAEYLRLMSYYIDSDEAIYKEV